MDLVWYGSGCFRMTERGYPVVITDPFVQEDSVISLPQLTSEIVTSSRLVDAPRTVKWPGVSGVQHTIAGPGEYEIGGVFITGVASYTTSESDELIPNNVIYAINMGGVIVCHFGECSQAPTQTQIEILGRTNVLLIPVGIPGGLSPTTASEIVSMIEPDVVVPTHYASSDKQTALKPVTPFLKLMGVDNPIVYASLKIENIASPGATQVALLEQMM